MLSWWRGGDGRDGVGGTEIHPEELLGSLLALPHTAVIAQQVQVLQPGSCPCPWPLLWESEHPHLPGRGRGRFPGEMRMASGNYLQ